MILRNLCWLFVVCVAVACGDASHDHGGGEHAHDHDEAHDHAHDDAAPDEPSALDEFLVDHAIRDEAGWLRVDLSDSDVTGGPRRVFVDKYAVVQALLGWAGEGDDGFPAPLAYAPGTVFVAENLDGEAVASTYVIRIGADGAPTFASYDGDGARTTTFRHETHGEDVRGEVPDDCRACHLGERVFAPFFADPRHRDAELLTHFGETVAHGSGVRGPYGGLLASLLAADLREGDLAKTDEMSVMLLSQRYADLLGIDLGGFGDDDGDDER